MIRNYHDLVQVSVDVDTSELERKLDELGGGLDEDRVRELIAEDSISDESVREIVSEALADEGLLNASDKYVESDDLDDRVREVLQVENYVTTSDYDFDDLISRVDALESVETPDVDELATLKERLDLQHQRIAELETTLASKPYVQGASLFDLLTQAARILGIAR